MTHICIGKLIIIGSDNGLLPGWHQAIIWTNAGILLIGPLGTNLSEISIEILIDENTFENVVSEILSILSRPQWVKLTTKNTSKLCITALCGGISQRASTTQKAFPCYDIINSSCYSTQQDVEYMQETGYWKNYSCGSFSIPLALDWSLCYYFDPFPAPLTLILILKGDIAKTIAETRDIGLCWCMHQ